MTLSEIYFYIIIIVYQLFSLVIITFTEDLKEKKYFNRYFKVAFTIGFLGIIMELVNWNYLCPLNSALLTFSPLLTLIICKGVMSSYEKIFKIEPHQMHYGKLIDGIWVNNKGDLKHRGYYGWYTANIVSFPLFVITAIFLLVEKNIC